MNRLTTGLDEAGFTASLDDDFPQHLTRDDEQKLLDLCASRSLEIRSWAKMGSPCFMAGVAVMLASVAGFDRCSLLALAERLYPGASQPATFARWLKHSPLQPSRFLAMLDRELAHAP